MRLILGLAAAVCLITGPAAERASADIVYALKNVRLEYLGKGAGALTGSFVTNDARTQLLEVNVAASGATVTLASWLPSVTFAAAAYSLDNSTDHSNLNGSILGLPLPKTLSLAQRHGETSTLSLIFALGLAATGESSIAPIVSGESQSLLLTRTVASGSVVARRLESSPSVAAVPEPSALAVAAICAPALLIYARPRRRKAPAAA